MAIMISGLNKNSAKRAMVCGLFYFYCARKRIVAECEKVRNAIHTVDTYPTHTHTNRHTDRQALSEFHAKQNKKRGA